jgi:hypothetical protein
MAIQYCQNALWSFSLTAMTRISLHGNSSHARTRCGCYKTSTMRNFGSWLFRYCHNVFWSFFSFIERFYCLSVTYISTRTQLQRRWDQLAFKSTHLLTKRSVPELNDQPTYNVQSVCKHCSAVCVLHIHHPLLSGIYHCMQATVSVLCAHHTCSISDVIWVIALCRIQNSQGGIWDIFRKRLNFLNSAPTSTESMLQLLNAPSIRFVPFQYEH